MKSPKGEKIWVTYLDVNKVPRFIITTKIDSRAIHYLYEVTDNQELVKLGKSSSPEELENKFHIKDKIKKFN